MSNNPNQNEQAERDEAQRRQQQQEGGDNRQSGDQSADRDRKDGQQR